MRSNSRASSDTKSVPYAGDPLLQWLFVTQRITPIQFGLLTLIIGFGVMAVFFLSMKYFQDPAIQLKGLFDYFSASIGDPLLLPLISIAIAYSYNSISNTLSRFNPDDIDYVRLIYSKKIWVILTILLSGAGVIGFHILAIFGPGRNWTLPEYGRINLAGIYHGLFMWFQLYIVIGYTIRQILTIYLIHKYSKQYNLTTLWNINLKLLIAILSIAGVFGGLLSADRLIPDNRWFYPLLVLTREATVISNWALGILLLCTLLYVDRKMYKMISPKFLFLSIVGIISSPIVTVYLFFVLL